MEYVIGIVNTFCVNRSLEKKEENEEAHMASLLHHLGQDLEFRLWFLL